jgi:hypothetical protein
MRIPGVAELRRRALDKVYKRRDRIDVPDFQREEVWTELQKRKPIDTILKGWHLPKFYFRRVAMVEKTSGVRLQVSFDSETALIYPWQIVIEEYAS